MRLPKLIESVSMSRQSIISFYGLNYSQLTRDGEFEDCLNLSSDDYPCISQRGKRRLVSEFENPTTLYSRAGLFVADGTTLKFNGDVVGEITEGEKQMAAVGDYVIIFPDKKYYNIDTDEFGDMEETYVSGAGQITFASTSDTDMKYATITTTGDNFNFRVGDAVEISGCTVNPENNQTLVIRDVSDKVISFYENSFTAGKETGVITIKRAVPDLDFICENNYRLWGCKGDTIYASKYSDPMNFNVFDGLTSDSYFIQVSSDGEFTGCISYSSYICFFKEDVLHRLYGTKPSNYQVLTSNVFGVQAGCHKSMCIINETLYYLGRNGIYAYTGSIPELISDVFGTKRFSNGCAGSDGNKYYIAMTSDDNVREIYTYDVLRNLWLKEDETDVIQFADIESRLYFLCRDGNLYEVDSDESDEVIEWSATFCPFTETVNERKGYSKLNLRLELEESAWLTVEVKSDNGNWNRVYTTHNERAKTILVPIKPNRCDSFKVRLSGKGSCRIRSMVRDFIVGSDWK